MLKLDFNERCHQFPSWASDVLSSLDDKALWRYPDRQTLENKLAIHFELNADCVLVTNGADEAIQLILSKVKQEETVLLPTPTFSMYEIGIKEWQCSVECIKPNADFTLDVNAINAAISAAENGWFILVRPNNPTGECLDLSLIAHFAKLCEERHIRFVLDEAYIEFAEDSGLQLLNDFTNILLLRTFSKAYGLAGLRVGFILASSKSLLAPIRQRCLPFNVNTISLTVASAALKTEAQYEVSHYCQMIRKNREHLSQWLKENGIPVIKSGGNFLFLSLEPLKKSLLLKACQLKGLVIKTFPSGALENCLRITIPNDITQILEAFKLAFTPDIICLDMDGVLIDTTQSYDSAVIETVKFFSGKSISLNTLNNKRCLGGFNNDWVLTQALLEDLHVEQSLENVTEVFQHYYLGTAEEPGLIANEAALIQAPLKSSITAQKFAIVTGRPRKEAQLGAKLAGLETLSLSSLDDVKESKPAPEGILQIKTRLNAQHLWMVGDNVDDIQAANSAGAIGIGVGSKREALLNAGAALVVDSINDLSNLIPESTLR